MRRDPDSAHRPGSVFPQDAVPAAHWRCNLGVTAVLLALWLLVSFVLVFFARDLGFDFFGWPFSFWVGAQGAVLAYFLITWFYAWFMARLDARHRIGAPPDTP